MADRGPLPPGRLWLLAGWAVAGLALALLVAVPLWRLLAAAVDGGLSPAWRTLTTGGTGLAVGNTVWTSLAATALAVLVGTAAAFVTERGRAPGRGLLRGLMLASLLAAPLVSALGWARAYGPAGLLDRLLGVSWPGLYGPAGVVVVVAAGAVPIAYLVVVAGLAARVEPDLERAARSSGASPWQALRTVTLPLARPAVGAAAALVFVAAVNAFEVPVVLGLPAGFATMTTRLYRDLALSADPGAFTAAIVLAAALVVVALAVLGPADLLSRGGRAVRTGAPAGSPASAGRRSWAPALTLAAFLVLTTVLPMVALLLAALTRAVGLAPVPANWTLANFSAVANGQAAAALLHSLLLAAAAATAVVLLGGLTAALGLRRAGWPLGSAVSLTFAVAGSALAVAMLLAYGRVLGDTLGIILVAYVAKFWALGHRPLAGAADRLPADLVRAGRVSGAGPGTAVRTVVVPFVRPALAGGWLLVFLFAVHELTMSSLLYSPGNETLAVVILNLQQLGDPTVTSALAVLLTAVVAAAALLLLAVRRLAVRGRTTP